MSAAPKIGEVTAKAAGNRGKGRPKGAQNKTTVAVKDALTEAFAGLGGVAHLQSWANDNPTEFYRIWSKLLPTEFKADVPGGITVIVQSKDERL